MTRSTPTNPPVRDANEPRAQAALLGLLALAAAMLFFRLGQPSLVDWDEAIYARISQEIVETGRWLTLHWEGRPYLRKPPVFMWTTAALFGVFGVSEFWARAASALSGVGVLVLTFLIGRRVYGPQAALLAAVVLLTSYQFVASARFGTTDVMLCLYFLCALYAYLRVQAAEPQWWLAVWLACALAFMTKSAAGLTAPTAVAICVALDRRVGTALRTRHFWGGAAVAALLVLPWHILMLWQHGAAFIDQYLGHSILDRATGVIDGHAGGRLYYVDRLYAYFFPWILLAPFALVLAVRDVLRGSAPPRIPLVAALLVFGLFTIAETKLRWYIVPLYPLLALFVGRLLYDALRGWRSFAFTSLLAGFAGLLLTASHTAAMIMLGASAAAVPLVVWRRRTAALVAAVSFAAVALSGLQDLYAGGEAPMARLARTAGTGLHGSEQRLILYQGLARPAALFYAGHPIELVDRETVLAGHVPAGETRHIILYRHDLAELSDRFAFRVLAEDWELVYATITARHVRGDDEG
jgi:4-amino-4-deoxy-L-arabinose transferase-like glycosyltransferase